MNARKDTKGFKNYAGVGKEEGFVPVSSPATATFYVFEGCIMFYLCLLQKKTQPLLVLSAYRPLLSNPLFCPSVRLSFCIPVEACRQAPDPEPAPAGAQPVPRREPGLHHCVYTRVYEIGICLPFKHLVRVEPCRACSLAEPLPFISTFPIMS